MHPAPPSPAPQACPGLGDRTGGLTPGWSYLLLMILFFFLVFMSSESPETLLRLSPLLFVV